MKQRLLIVDDEPGIVDMMASYFSSQYEVLTAYCGNEALQKLARQPDLILLDINMTSKIFKASFMLSQKI